MPGADLIDEQRLVGRARRGDREAFGQLYDAHVRALLGRAVTLLKHRAQAEDLVQDVFVEAWRSLEQYEPDRGSFGAWLGARLRSRAIDRLRQRARRSETDAIPEVADLQVPDPATKIDASRIPGWMEALSPEQREAIELAYFRGLPLREIAERQGVAEGTVKARVSRGLARLRAEREACS